MAGIYLHIPFCKKRCIYCDFYSSTRSDLRTRYVEALCSELEQRIDYLEGAPVRTLYLGGGTPSQLTTEQLQRIFDTMQRLINLNDLEEVTLEANPDDLTARYVEGLTTLPINRLSMGIQSFDDSMLRLLNRRHTAQQARDAVERCRAAGFSNLSIDLMYGLPGQTAEAWRNDLQQAIALGVEHISAYHLSVEEGTPLHRLCQANRLHEADEELSVMLFEQLTTTLQQAGYLQYEISNFCLPNRHSRHNSAYWQGIPYLGCGASAHSYNGVSREWNVASIDRYIGGIVEGERDFEQEQLDQTTRYNEMVMTALRTREGLSLEQLKQQFGTSYHDYCLDMAHRHLEQGLMALTEGRLHLTHQGIFVSDALLSDLMII